MPHTAADEPRPDNHVVYAPCPRATNMGPCVSASRSLLSLILTPYAALTLLGWAWMYSQFLVGVNQGPLSAGERWYVTGSFWIHFAALALLAWLTAHAARALLASRPGLADLAVAVLGAGATTWLFADSRLYSITGLHANRFVLEAVLQPDGISHIGVDPATVAISAWPLLLLLVPQMLVRRLSRPKWASIGLGPTVGILGVCAVLLGIDKLAYAAFYVNGAPFVFELKSAVPFYPTLHDYHARLLYGKVFGQSKVGFMEPMGERLDHRSAAPQSRFAYPAAPLPAGKVARPLNVIFIVAESLRASDVDSKSSPRLTSLSNELINAQHHFSSSNCTHLGLFSLLYGLNPHFFHDARMSKVRPVGFQVLDGSNYSLYATLSRTMKWYDMDRFAFSGFSSFEPDGESTVERDRAVTDHAVQIARQHAASGTPYFDFVYYYATHADYQHPADEAPFQPSLRGRLNLASPDLRDKREALVNRYRNAIHFIDGEVGRLVDALKREGVWDRTVLVFTGDHGEEFFEQGRLGHNSGFNREQTQVPLLLHIPGAASRQLEKVTSHMDVFQTLLGILGAPASTMANFQGRDMLGPESGAVYIGMAHYQRPQKFAIVDQDTRTIVDLEGGSPVVQSVSTLDGKALETAAPTRSKVLLLLQQMRTPRPVGVSTPSASARSG